MATRAEMDHLASKLSTLDTFSWVVRGLPVVALMREEGPHVAETLGQPLDKNGAGHVLRLWIGVDRTSMDLFITLTIRIRVSQKRLRPGAGRLMYLVIPAEHLLLQSALVDYGDNLPLGIFDMPTDLATGNYKLTQMSFDVLPVESRVIMPEYEFRTTPPAQSLAMLRTLKRLSTSHHFDLYANPNEDFDRGIRDACDMLSSNQGRRVKTPTVDLKALYPGNRPGGINLWSNQGLPEDEPSTVEKYDATTSSALGPPTASVVQLPPYEPPFTNPPTTFDQEGTAIHPAPEDIRSGSVAAQPSLEHHGFFSPLPPSSPLVAQSSLSCGYSATFLSGMFTPVDTTADPPVYTIKAFPDFLPATAKHPEASEHRVRRQASVSFDVEVSASSPVIATPRCTPGATGSPVRVTDSLKRNRSLRCSRTDVGDSEDSPSNKIFVADRTLSRRIHSLQKLFGSDIVLVSPTVVDSAPPSLEQTTISEEDADRETEERKAAPMTEWLTEAWKYCPDAYRLFNVELSWFGSALACGADRRVIADCHLSCTLALIRHCTRIAIVASPDATGLTDGNLVRDADLSALLTWLCELHLGADMKLFPALLDLSLLGQRVLSTCPRAVELDALKRQHTRQKAVIVSRAYLRFGQQPDRDGHEMVARISA
ncbi:hypothetical protein KCU99_g9967, partial [Aureobasidium melanogenum]|uniref:Uncharacterized protein n=1 Tax=Aureobasidium pullulans TaxID=5580 RepID=A0A4T0B9Z1_AURPU